jgi:hypothetical protein
MAAVLDAQALADQLPPRPFVRDARTRRFREKDFRAEAKAKVGGAKWKKMTVKQRDNAIRKGKRNWTKENVGTVPGITTYDQWLRTQPRAFQNEVLGVKKAQAFRGGLKLDKFIDRRGQELTLVQLKEKFPDIVAFQ